MPFQTLKTTLAIGLCLAVLAPTQKVFAEDAEFDPFLVPTQAEPSFEEQKLARRHKMLQAHQWIGYSTLALVTTQVAIGWATFAERRKSGFSQKFDSLGVAHRYLGIASWTSYMTGASMAIFTPKIDNKDSDDTIKTHRRLAWVHGIGMGVLPVWGWLAKKKRSDLISRQVIDGRDNGKPVPSSAYDAVSASHGAWATGTWGALVGAYITVMIR